MFHIIIIGTFIILSLYEFLVCRWNFPVYFSMKTSLRPPRAPFCLTFYSLVIGLRCYQLFMIHCTASFAHASHGCLAAMLIVGKRNCDMINSGVTAIPPRICMKCFVFFYIRGRRETRTHGHWKDDARTLLCLDWLIGWLWWGENMSQNCGHQRAYCSSPGWYINMESHGDN
jgi:hypothetical protein